MRTAFTTFSIGTGLTITSLAFAITAFATRNHTYGILAIAITILALMVLSFSLGYQMAIRQPRYRRK